MPAPARFFSFLALGLGLGLGLGLAWFARRPAVAPGEVSAPVRPPPAPLAAAPAPASPLPPASGSVSAASLEPSPAVEAGPASGPAETDPERYAALAARLDDAARSREPAALPVIAPHLKHADPAVRELAREALLQLGLAEAAPLLRAAAEATRDPREAVALLDAAAYLELPPAAPVATRVLPRPSGEATTSLKRPAKLDSR